MDKLVSWDAVSSRLEQAKARIVEREKEAERNESEEQKPRSSEATPEIYSDSDAELGADDE